MKKSLSKKFLGLGLGILMIAGVVGAVSIGGNIAEAVVIESNYARAREKFTELSFEEQKATLTELLQDSIDEYSNSDSSIYGGAVTGCEKYLQAVEEAKTSDDLIKLVDEEETLLNTLV